MKMICLNFVRRSGLWLIIRSQCPRSFHKKESAEKGEETSKEGGLQKIFLWHLPSLLCFSFLILNVSFGLCLLNKSCRRYTDLFYFIFTSRFILQILIEHIVNKAVTSQNWEPCMAPAYRDPVAEMRCNSKTVAGTCC